MTVLVSAQEAICELARDPLRNVVLLKQLSAYPRHVKVHRACGAEGVAILVVLGDVGQSLRPAGLSELGCRGLHRQRHPKLTATLARHVPRGVGVVFKLSHEADRAAVEAQFAVTRRTAFVSFTATGGCEPDPGVGATEAPGDAAFALLELQGHERSWLEPLLRDGRAFARVLEGDGDTRSACVAFENYGPVWEVGGVVTAPSQRRKGLGARVVRTALAELARRGLAPRYQVEESNIASIALAHAIGLRPFVIATHYAHAC